MPNDLDWLHLIIGSTGSTPNLSRMTELLTLFLRENSATLQSQLLDLILLVTTQSSQP